jgi:putative restriction endonuclease
LDTDLAVRIAAFKWLTEKTSALGEVVPRALLQEGFIFEGNRVPLIAPQGIFKPKILDLPLSITTTTKGPYSDDYGPSGLNYRYRGTDPDHPENFGLRTLMRLNRPLIYFFGIVPGRYLAVWPVYITGDNPETLSFNVLVDDKANFVIEEDKVPVVHESDVARRAYYTSTIRVRLHQHLFRERVIEAYQSQCSLCRLRHIELLDAAHIIPDSAPEGEPLITNGIALCKLHHAAYDSFILSISPDYVIHVRQDVLEEHDGPVLLHALKEMNGNRIILPKEVRYWPNKGALEQRYDAFIQH